jgi:ribosomal-protein-alanine N-acetyltransferase
MSPGDLPIVSEIERNSFSSPWSELSFRSELQNPLTECIVADASGEVIGYLCVSIVLDEAHLLTLGVSPLWRRKGVGRSMMLYILDLLRGYGVRKLFLEVRTSNQPAIRLYESLGFNRIGLRRGYYSFPREDAIVMMKGLSP